MREECIPRVMVVESKRFLTVSCAAFAMLILQLDSGTCPHYSNIQPRYTALSSKLDNSPQCLSQRTLNQINMYGRPVLEGDYLRPSRLPLKNETRKNLATSDATGVLISSSSANGSCRLCLACGRSDLRQRVRSSFHARYICQCITAPSCD